MRRSEREIAECSQINEILERCKVCRIGMIDGEEVYIVPMNFGYSISNGSLNLYFHCADEGRRIELLKKNDSVGFEMDCGHSLVEGEDACQYSFRYASIIGNGRVEFIAAQEEKIKGLNVIMKHQTGKTFEFNAQMVNAVTMFKISAQNYSCKKH